MARHDQLSVTEVRQVCFSCREGDCTTCVDVFRQKYSVARLCSCSRNEHSLHVTPVGTAPTARIGDIE